MLLTCARRLFAGMLIAIAALGASIAAQQITNRDLIEAAKTPDRWLTYSGDYSGRRHSPLTQITPANVQQLTAQWTFQTGVLGKFEATPIILDGIIYITGPNNTAWALDARTGRSIWQYQRILPDTAELNVCCGMVNRGIAVYRDLLLMTTLDAHLVALDMKTGKQVYDVVLEDYKRGYASTMAPLLVKDKVIVGIAGAEFGIRGFIDAYDAATGKRDWRFYTVAGPGEPGGDT
jgi:alcohol dehydrogenase (cytochrome c)